MHHSGGMGKTLSNFISQRAMWPIIYLSVRMRESKEHITIVEERPHACGAGT